MKANEFVKLRGISYCKELLIKADGCAAIQAREDNSRVSVDDLKRLVESHELVEKLGGLSNCKKLIIDYGKSESADHLSYHVANVESCQ